MNTLHDLNLLTVGFMVGCLLTWFIFSRYRQWLLAEIQRAEKTERECVSRMEVMESCMESDGLTITVLRRQVDRFSRALRAAKSLVVKHHESNYRCDGMDGPFNEAFNIGPLAAAIIEAQSNLGRQITESELPKVTEE